MSHTTTSAATSSTETASTSNTDGGSSLHPFVTQKLVETRKYYCPFLERGFCRESAKCNFSHDCHTATKIPTDFCHFYLANQCLYGQDCKFIHGEPIIDPIEDAALNIENINLSEINHENDGYEHQSFHDYDDPEVLSSEMVNSEYEYYNQDNHELQMQNNLELSNHIAGDISSNPVSAEPEPAATTSYAAQSKHEVVASSSSFSHDNDLFPVENKHTANSSSPSPKPPGSPSNFQLLRAIVTGDASSSGGSKSSATIRHISCKIIDSAKSSDSSTKAWQGGRLLASLKGESSSNQENHLKQLPLCPYSLATGGCPYPDGCCTYLHGQICDLCCMPCLHPYDEAQQRQHRDDCLREHEREMELSFAVQRSKDKICGICMDTVVEKKPVTSSRFGILEKCNHIFCLDCIRKWRGTKQFDSKTIRACPECRVNSDFVVPSKYWVEDQDDKEKLIHDYKAALRSKPCRYFNEGKGECPFAGSCFYKHAYPDGRLAEMEAPKHRRRLYGARGTTTLTNYVLWSLIRTFDDDDWSDAESNSHFYIQDEDEDDEDDDGDEEEDDEAIAANVADYTAPIW